MLTADQIAEFRREHGFILPASSLPLFAEICEQAAECATIKRHWCEDTRDLDELEQDRDRWRAMAERLGEALSQFEHSDSKTTWVLAHPKMVSALAELRAMQT